MSFLGSLDAGGIPILADDLRARGRGVLEAHWRAEGFCVPNGVVYPGLWLWDSCFHAVCWAHFGEGERGVVELSNVLARQEADGFVPHMSCWEGEAMTEFWGRADASMITQPPMYGHAIAELHRLGVAVPGELIERARRGLRYFFSVRMRDGVGPVIVHPWESGCDNSARWDAWCGARWCVERWREVKGELVGVLDGGRSTRFEVASAGFGALVAFNARELAWVTGDADLRAEADALAGRLAARWDEGRRTWVDEVVVGPRASAGVRTLDALLPVLVVDDDQAVEAALAEVLDGGAYGGRCGPAGCHRGEPSFDPHAYWRGPAWPQLTYLFWVAARRRGYDEVAARLGEQLMEGAVRSGFAEYWSPDSGRGLGAVPQGWTALAGVVAGGY